MMSIPTSELTLAPEPHGGSCPRFGGAPPPPPPPPSASFAALMPRGGSPGDPRLAHTPLTGATRRAPLGSLPVTRRSRLWPDFSADPHRSLDDPQCDTRGAGVGPQLGRARAALRRQG